MTAHNRATLGNYFADGQLPTGEHFRDLIDSMLNMEDEGFRKTPRNGFEVAALDRYDTLLSFYRQQRPQEPLWSVRLAEEDDRLQFRRADAAAPVLTLDAPMQGEQRRPRVGILTDTPAHELDVAGTLRARGRIGGLAPPGDAAPRADGQWHDITEPLRGCQAFEVMAGCGRDHSGRFALLQASAMNAFNPGRRLFGLLDRKPIREQHAWYGKRCDRLQLRWDGGNGRNAEYRLQIRTRCVYGEDVPIHVQLTQLWFDPFMQGPAP